MALAPLPLRLANLRRFLSKMGTCQGDNYDKLLAMIRKQSIPVYIRKDSNHWSSTNFVAVVMEYVPKADGRAYNTQPWYVLNNGDFETIEQAAAWIATNCEYYIPEYIG